MRRRPNATPARRDWLDRLRERRGLKLMRLGLGTPADERRWARECRLPVAELRRRAAQNR
jgi:hypothetical protein